MDMLDDAKAILTEGQHYEELISLEKVEKHYCSLRLQDLKMILSRWQS